MTHRDELFDVSLRWLNDSFDPGDCRTISRIFVYESVIAAVLVRDILCFLEDIFGFSLKARRVREKQLLRRCLIDCLPHSSERIKQLLRHYQTDPEFYFPRAPFDGLLVQTPSGRLAAIGRIKRLSRVAEKVSFRLADALFREINDEARLLAARRAAQTGTVLADLVSTEQEMQNDFTAAEAAVAARFRDRHLAINQAAVTINDLLGFKIVGGAEFLERIPELLDRRSGFTVVEIERHRGEYNAVNLLVQVQMPNRSRLIEQSHRFDWSIAVQRGLDPAALQAGFASYLAEGADTVIMEIILTSDEELIESEFGRSMHELRILRLRSRQTYSGPIAQNASFLIEYLLALALSPKISVSELPIRMYGRYLPETIAIAKCSLCGKRSDDELLQAFSLVCEG
jgi:hypothetical protein